MTSHRLVAGCWPCARNHGWVSNETIGKLVQLEHETMFFHTVKYESKTVEMLPEQYEGCPDFGDKYRGEGVGCAGRGGRREQRLARAAAAVDAEGLMCGGLWLRGAGREEGAAIGAGGGGG